MQNILKFESNLNIKFKNRSLLIAALTHKSANQEINNEKLEFLGDRVIGLVLSKKIFDLYPNVSEGVLDKRFASLVNKKTCSDIARSMGIQNCIITGNKKINIIKVNEKMLSDCCEAVIGAIYIDRGFEIVKNYILRIWKKKIDKSDITILDPKTKLQEYSLKKFKRLPAYRLINSSGPKHSPVYKISVTVTGSKQYTGVGNSKQLAELDGALKLLTAKNIK